MVNPPTELRLSADKQTLSVTFVDVSAPLAAELLRVESPSAEVQGHGPTEKRLVPGKQGVAITAVEPVGTYAVKLVFSDGHQTGFYTWDYLHELARTHGEKWQAYLTNLAQAGLSRTA